MKRQTKAVSTQAVKSTGGKTKAAALARAAQSKRQLDAARKALDDAGNDPVKRAKATTLSIKAMKDSAPVLAEVKRLTAKAKLQPMPEKDGPIFHKNGELNLAILTPANRAKVLEAKKMGIPPNEFFKRCLAKVLADAQVKPGEDLQRFMAKSESNGLITLNLPVSLHMLTWVILARASKTDKITLADAVSECVESGINPCDLDAEKGYSIDKH